MLFSPTVRISSAGDLTAVWRTLRGGLRFADLVLWALAVDGEGHPGRMFALTGLPDGPYDVLAGDLDDLIGEFLAGSSVALLYGRPGSGPWHIGDRAWAGFLERVPLRVPRWPVHRARDDLLELVPGSVPSSGLATTAGGSSGSLADRAGSVHG